MRRTVLVVVACVIAIVVLLLYIAFNQAQPAEAGPPGPLKAVPDYLFQPVVVTPRPGPVGSPALFSRLTEKSLPPVLPTRTEAPMTPVHIPAAPTPAPSATAGFAAHGGGASTTGVVSWYPASGFIAATHSWHWGDTPYTVKLCTPSTCIEVLVQDYCAGCTGGRLLDLSDDAFRALAPLSAGLVRVQAYGWR